MASKLVESTIGKGLPKGRTLFFSPPRLSAIAARGTADKMMSQKQASLHAPQNEAFGFSYGDAAYEEQMEASGLGELGFTGYVGKQHETDEFDIDDRLDDVKFLHSPFVERSPAGGWPMKYALLGEYNPTMSSVIGTKCARRPRTPPGATSNARGG